MALQITDANFEELVNSGKPMVLDFWAEWCGPCRMVGPIIDEPCYYRQNGCRQQQRRGCTIWHP